MNAFIVTGFIVMILGAAIGILPTLVVLALGKRHDKRYTNIAAGFGLSSIVIVAIGLGIYVYGFLSLVLPLLYP
jgi:hypothetical protein